MGNGSQQQQGNPKRTLVAEYRERESIGVALGVSAFIALLLFLTPPDEAWDSSPEMAYRTVIAFAMPLLFLIMLLTPQVHIRLFHEHMAIFATLGLPFRISIRNDSIVSVRAITKNPFAELRPGWLRLQLRTYAWARGSEWEGWVPYRITLAKTAIAIETTSRKYLVSCTRPDIIADKIREIIGKTPQEPGKTLVPHLKARIFPGSQRLL